LPAAKPIKSVVAYTPYGWDTALVVLRISGPLAAAGLELLPGCRPEPGLLRTWPELVDQADAVLIQRDFPREQAACRQIVARAHAQGKPVIYDLDDLLLELPEDHPDRATHYYTSALFPMLETLLAADLVTAAAPHLATYLQAFNPRVRLLPNYLNDSLWRTPQPARQAPGRLDTPPGAVTIGYMGGDSHLPDLAWLAPALLGLLQQAEAGAPPVYLHFIGAQPPAELLAHPHVRWEPAKTYNYAEFAADFSARQFDLAIAPLRDNLFNRCKSAIKFMDYSILGLPGVYSRLEPYTWVVQDGYNGRLAGTLEEWTAALQQLVHDATLRRRLGAQAQQTVQHSWRLSDHGQDINAIFQEALQPALPRLQTLPTAIVQRLTQQVQDYQWQLQLKVTALNTIQTEAQTVNQSLQAQLAECQARLGQAGQADAAPTAAAELNEIKNSRAWQIALALRQARVRLLPSGSRRAALAQRLWAAARRLAGKPPQA
jgi:glycosyltransferase involved in cell wall biosynthesis